MVRQWNCLSEDCVTILSTISIFGLLRNQRVIVSPIASRSRAIVVEKTLTPVKCAILASDTVARHPHQPSSDGANLPVEPRISPGRCGAAHAEVASRPRPGKSRISAHRAHPFRAKCMEILSTLPRRRASGSEGTEPTCDRLPGEP